MQVEELDCEDQDRTTVSGYLTRPPKNGKSLVVRRKRFYKLDGSLFSKHASEGSPASTVINLRGAEVKEVGQVGFAIVLKDEEKITSFDVEKKVLVLCARNEKECGVWVWALRAAAQRRLKQYYEVGKVIGEGGFAFVRIGRCLKTKELRAIKTLKKDDTYAKLQGQEIAIIKSTEHPNIVKTYDVFETKGEIHIVMEFMAGGMLYDAIEDEIKFTEADVVQFMKEILDGILYLHGKGIVHRDLKPENILCTSRTPPLHVKISDFGLSCITNVAALKANQVLMSTMIGTPQFIAPEIARQEPYTEKVDMWALGMLCHNVIAGELPIDESVDVIPQIRNGVQLTFQQKVWSSYRPDARSFIRALLCKEPQKRLSPLGCMVHPWLEKDNGRPSTKIAAHGRVSHRISTMNLGTSHRNLEARIGTPTSRKPIFNRKRFVSGRHHWKTTFLAISAMNRFQWLVTPRQPDPVDQIEDVDFPPVEDDGDGLGNDSDDSCSNSWSASIFTKAVQSAKGAQGQPSLPSPIPKKSMSFRKQKRISREDGPQSLSALLGSNSGGSGSGPSILRKKTWREKAKNATTRDGALTRKKTVRGKEKADVPNGTSPLRKVSRKLTTAADNAGFLGPLRKISRKLTAGGRKGGATDDIDLDLSLEYLGLTDVDESDLLLLEDELCDRGTSGDRTSKGGKSSKSFNQKNATSPVTPGKQ